MGPDFRSSRALLLYVFGLLPFQGVAHGHGDDPGHGACQLCLATGQPLAAPEPTVVPAALPVLRLPVPGASPRPARVLPPPHESRGPPSA